MGRSAAAKAKLNDAPTTKDISFGKALAQAILKNSRLTREQNSPFARQLQKQAEQGALSPPIMRLLWEAAYGFPEKSEAVPPAPVRIIHKYVTGTRSAEGSNKSPEAATTHQE